MGQQGFQFICRWQKFSLLIGFASRRLHVKDVRSLKFPVAPELECESLCWSR